MPEPDGLIEIFLQPGELYFGAGATRIRTLLGSCVSLTFWHPLRLIGGMCHYLLPTRPQPSTGALDGRYGDEAMALMLQQIRAAGARPEEFRVRLFGGGNMFPQIERLQDSHVGRKNVAAARRLIQVHRLVCSGADVEGVGHRQLIFDLWSGQVSLKQAAPRAPSLSHEEGGP